MEKYPEPQFDYQADLAINKNRLDEELLLQPQKMMRYNTAHAQAQFDRDRAKQALDVTKANLDASIRAELTTAGAKFTEAVVDGRIRTSPTYIEAQDKLIKAEYNVNVTFAGVMAMNARRPILEDLVRLYLNGYWSEPRVQGGEGMKAGAAMAATEDAIMRSQDIPDVDKPVPTTAPTPRRPPAQAGR